jgi:hypothetical protein
MSVADKLVARGFAKGLAEGFAKGKWLGKIQVLQDLMESKASPSQSLEDLDLGDLQEEFHRLLTEYKERFKELPTFLRHQ